MTRMAKTEFNIELKLTPKFIGVFEHFYDDGVYEDVSTHYINLAYEVNINNETLNLPVEQHNEYHWLTIDELIKSKQVHKHVKVSFRK